MSLCREKVRQRCIDLMRDIGMMERNGEYNTKLWNRAKLALDRALDSYRQQGATTADIADLSGVRR